MPRRLGQHFLVRTSVVQRIVKALDLKPQDSLLEIGPGRGALTRSLVQASGKLLLVEKDTALAAEMQERLAGESHVKVLEGDFLEVPWDRLRDELGDEFKVVSNLPYNAGTAILLKLLENAAPGTTMVLMFQKEVGERLSAGSGSKDFGSLTLFCQIFASVKSLFEVPPAAFRPPPKVRSLVVKLRLREKPLVDRAELPDFEALTHAGFAHRRKMLRQNLRSYFKGESAEQIESRLHAVSAKPTARAEELSLDQWLALFRAPAAP